MAKSLNPMEAYRREQKKKELKKHRVERQKDKQSKLSSMDPTELREQLKALERQVTGNPSDGPTRKRKQELEETLRAVVKRQKEMQDEELKKQKEAPPPPPMSATELNEANRDKFQNPENSIYYHPTLNPFGAPPPGMPQRYRGMPPPGVGPPRGGYQGQQKHRGPPPPPRGPPQFGGREPPPVSMQQPRAMARRPGKRPPLPLGPPPPGTIQVPPRPPLPSGGIPLRPPPPPPMHAQTAAGVVPQQPRDMVPPPPPYPTTAADAEETEGDQDAEEDGVVAPYPTTDEPNVAEEDPAMNEEAAERAAELRSLVPVALRVQRQAPAPSSSVLAPPAPAPRRPVPAPRPAVPSIAVAPPRPPTSAPNSTSNSVSKELDAFMEEMKELL